MSSLKPKESGSYVAPPPPRQGSWIPIALIVAIIGIAAVAFGGYFTKSSLDSRITELEQELQQVKDANAQDLKKLQGSTNSLASDLTVVTKKMGVTVDELTQWCDSDGGALFTLAPPPLEVVTGLADLGEVMPPKTTYFEPKPCAGIFRRP